MSADCSHQKVVPRAPNEMYPVRESEYSRLFLFKPSGVRKFRLESSENQREYEILEEKEGTVLSTYKFLEILKLRGLSPKTIRAYAYDLLAFLRWYDSQEILFADFTEGHLYDWIAVQTKSRAHPRTINRRLGIVSHFYEFLAGKDLPKGKGYSPRRTGFRAIGYDRGLGIFRKSISGHTRIRVKIPQRLSYSLEVNEVNSFLFTLKRYRDMAMVGLMLFCGLRSAEVRGLLLKSIQVLDRSIRVLGKGNRERVIPLPGFLIGVIQRYVEMERPVDINSETLFVVLQGSKRGQG